MSVNPKKGDDKITSVAEKCAKQKTRMEEKPYGCTEGSIHSIRLHSDHSLLQ